MTITGNADLSKDILHKQLNYIYQNEQEAQEAKLYTGKNFALSMIKHVCNRQINLAQAIRLFEDRFLDTADKDFLLMIIESMLKGKQVHVTKAVKQAPPTTETPDGGNKGILSVKDKESILNIFEILGGTHNR